MSSGKFFLSPTVSNKFKHVVEIDSKVLGKFFPVGGTLQAYEEFNARQFKAIISTQRFLEEINKYAKSVTTFQDCEVLAMGTAHNLPCFFVKDLFPWDDPNDSIENHGVYIDGAGLGFLAKCGQDIVDHEIIHAVQRYYVHHEIMPIRKRWHILPRNIDEVYLRLRKEAYAYWLGSPKLLKDNKIETLALQLTGCSLEKLQSNYLTPEDSRKLLDVLKCIGLLDKTTKGNLNFKSKIAVKLLKEPDFQTFYDWLLVTSRSYNK